MAALTLTATAGVGYSVLNTPTGKSYAIITCRTGEFWVSIRSSPPFVAATGVNGALTSPAASGFVTWMHMLPGDKYSFTDAQLELQQIDVWCTTSGEMLFAMH